MSSDPQRHTVSRNLVRISGFGYRENIANQRSDAARSTSPIMCRLVTLASESRRTLFLPSYVGTTGTPGPLPAPTVI